MRLIRNDIVKSEGWLTGVPHEEDGVRCREASPYYLSGDGEEHRPHSREDKAQECIPSPNVVARLGI